MVGFLTLFLGLVLGPQDVRLMVDDTVAAVELRLDGVPVARIEGAPWKATVDFGDALVPRRLEAVSFDAEGRELERTRQAINRPRPEAEAVLVLERDEAGRPAAARLSWQALGGMALTEVSATLDGEPLSVTDPARIPLPLPDPHAFHFLQIELAFEGGATANTQAAFGGAYLGETAGELTAIPVLWSGKKKKVPDAAEAASWFLVGDEPQRVVAVEEGAADLLLVRGSGVERYVWPLWTVSAPGLDTMQLGGTEREGSLDALDAAGRESDAARQRAVRSLPPDHHLRLLVPWPKKTADRHVTMDSFVISPRLTRGLLWTLSLGLDTSSLSSDQRIADAVAVAAQRAAWGNRRRAVILVLAEGATDASVLVPEEVLRYLDVLGVPIHVWRLGDARDSMDGWPKGERITTSHDLRRAVGHLTETVDSQRVVWIEGSHPAESVTLAKGARFRRLVAEQVEP